MISRSDYSRVFIVFSAIIIVLSMLCVLLVSLLFPVKTTSLTTSNQGYSSYTQSPNDIAASKESNADTPTPTESNVLLPTATADATSTPESKVTPKPTQKNTTPATYELTGELPECKRVSSSYFDSVVFVGDSITDGLHDYNKSKNALGKAVFLARVNFGAGNALRDVTEKSYHPLYNGVKRKVEDSIPLTGKTKVYIMFGANDLDSFGVDGSVKRYEQVCNNILEKAPYVQIFIQSMTPVTSRSCYNSEKGVSNKNIILFNQKLVAMCERRGWCFVNVASAMYDDNGCLRDEYCCDVKTEGTHFSTKGCAAWVEYLYTHALVKQEATPTPTPEVTPTPTPTPTPEATATPTLVPSPSASSTNEKQEEN